MQPSVANGLFYVCFFLLGISAIEHYFKRSIIPPVSRVLLAGVAYSVANNYGKIGLPQLGIQPEIGLYIFLPVLIFYSSSPNFARAFAQNLPAAWMSRHVSHVPRATWSRDDGPAFAGPNGTSPRSFCRNTVSTKRHVLWHRICRRKFLCQSRLLHEVVPTRAISGLAV